MSNMGAQHKSDPIEGLQCESLDQSPKSPASQFSQHPVQGLLIEIREIQLTLSPPSLLTCSAMTFFRNLSSADMGRQTMRNYPGLIDSVMTYAQNCVASNRPDDKVPAAAPQLFTTVHPHS